MQQTLVGCAFCDAGPEARLGQAGSWGRNALVTHPIYVDRTLREHPDPNDAHRFACDGCGCFVDAVAVLTRYRVQLGHLEGPLHLCARCSPDEPATYWTHEREAHLVRDA
ncbi:hypothetical protein EFA46_014975 (plasmid) [Halarchaeum sp. CBA1220]|uniref:DUF7558 family protein n=1 Tax=Halarchaeum sp. CBA1220 TaxID=1853682 RepID=UPI000F3A8714|nr:hypothetical protein [Halarchaeum sp. CBA1220]QLC35621.1 hypothetical protein EFA46_014975 [Halarchaeum sp. CBA1220]